MAIRQTWGKSAVSSGCPTLFLVGGSEDENLKQDLFVEYSQYGDLVIADFNDTYSNLVIKTGFMLKYLQQAGNLVSENKKILKPSPEKQLLSAFSLSTSIFKFPSFKHAVS